MFSGLCNVFVLVSAVSPLGLVDPVFVTGFLVSAPVGCPSSKLDPCELK